MSLKFFKYIYTVLCWTLLVLPGWTQTPDTVKSATDLARIAGKLGTSPVPGNQIIHFNFYGNPGQFKLDTPPAGLGSITFQRLSQDSIGVLRPTNNLPLFDIKGLQGTLTLKGLAFHLPSNRSRLIAGAEAGKENGNLILDNCFIYADSLDGPFLGWLAGAGKVEIRNSYIVTKVGHPTARLNLSAPEVVLSNNLFNFPGGIDVSVTSRLDVASNTVNRTQFNIRTDNIGVPTFHFTRNLIAHRPETNAYGAGVPWVLYHSGFDAGISSVLLNKRFNTWTGFDYDSEAKWKATPGSNEAIAPVAGKPATELWNWYVDEYESEVGMLFGVPKPPKYNVLPETKNYTWKTSIGDLSVQFRPALFPRMIALDTTERVPALDSASFRPVHTKGVLQFGPFEIESIVIDAKALHGQPVLLANDANGKFAAQIGGSAIDVQPSVFGNVTASARRYILAEKCNTPRGAMVTPGSGSLLNPNDKLVFEQVETAGRTIVSEMFEDFPDNLRRLGNIQVRTTAAVKGKISFGLQTTVTSAYWTDRIQWYVVRSDTSLQEPSMTVESGKFTGTANYTSENGSPLSANLVEKLTVPRNGKVFEFPDGSVRAVSKSGYQLEIDTTALLDTVNFAIGSKGYRFSWAGRTGEDTLFLNLTSRPDMAPFVKVGVSAPESLALAKDTSGLFRIPIAMVDSGKVFFLGMKYNIIAKKNYSNAAFSNVTVDKFSSATSGKLAFTPITSGMVSNRLGSFEGSVRFVSGIKMVSTGLTVAAGWDAYFSAPGYVDTSKVDAYYHDGSVWKPLEGRYVLKIDTLLYQVRSIPASATEIILLEMLPPVSQSVITDTSTLRDTLKVSTIYRDPPNRRITHFCVEVKSMDDSGEVEIDSCEKNTHPIGTANKVTIPLLANRAYSYKVEYLEGTKPYATAPYVPILSKSWDKSLAVPISAKVKEAFQWHLVGFPLKSKWDQVLKKHEVVSDASAKDTTYVRKIELVNDTDAFVEVRDLKSEFAPGTAFLFASARECYLQMDLAADFLPLKAHSVEVKKGWNLIANPFPTAFPLSRLSLANPSDQFRALSRIEKDNYQWLKPSEWKVPSVLEKFTGYAYFSEKEGLLEFDPLAPETSAYLAKAKAMAGSGPSRRISARLHTQWGSSEAILTSDSRGIDIPFLPVPGSSPQLRLGAKGLMVKTVSDGAAIDEIVEIKSPQAGRGSFRLEFSGGAFEAVRLIHLASGKVFDGSGADEIPLAKGSQTFRLLAGDMAFVRAGTESLLAGTPKDIRLSQNYPNPFRGKTQVALDWPAWDGGDRRAVLEVVDMQGRNMTRMDLGAIRMGRQILTVDASGWRPGIYMYRLTVDTAGKKARLQKRMLVSP